MHFQPFATAREFLRDVERDLARREVEHHLVLGVAGALAAEADGGGVEVLAAVRDDAGLALAALMKSPRPLLLATDRSEPRDAIDKLAGWLHDAQIAPDSLVADVHIAESFAEGWQRIGGSDADVKMRQRLFVLRAVSAIRIVAGELRQATTADMDLLERWMAGFNTEALGTPAEPDLRKKIARRVSAGEMYLWVDREPRAMVASARPTRRGIAINSVYTPPEWRGRGYASSCVAKLSDLLLSQGREFCVLYTDLANATSNAIYTRIGFRPVADSLLISFNSK